MPLTLPGSAALTKTRCCPFLTGVHSQERSRCCAAEIGIDSSKDLQVQNMHGPVLPINVRQARS